MARIYVIDDDEQLLRMVGLMLERGGHTITLISNPLEGWERIQVDKPDLLVLDVMMPGMSGHDLTRQIRGEKSLEDVPILILTARSQDIDRTTALKSGADDYLSKPVTSQELIERVDNLLSRKVQRVASSQKVIVALYGFRGGVGQTTVAVNLATALRRLSQEDVCLVDFSPSGSQAEKHIRLKIRSTWADLPDSFDWPMLKDSLALHPSGLRLLAAPSAPVSPMEPSAEKASAILDLLSANMVFTVVDLPSAYTPALQIGLSRAYMALHVITPEVVAVQTAVRVNRMLTKAGINMKYKSHILNQITPEAHLSQAGVERGLGVRIGFQIGYDPNQVRAIAQVVPLTLTPAKTSLPAVVNRMAEAIWQRVRKDTISVQ